MLNVKRRHFVLAATGLGAALAYAGWRNGATGFVHGLTGQDPFVRTSHALGTKVSITVLESDQRRADVALDAAFRAIEEVESNLSIYRADSQLSQLNKVGFVTQPHDDLVKVLNCACQTSQQSQGAFDVTVQPLWDLFSWAQHSGRIPTTKEISQARRSVDWRRVQIARNEVRLLGDGTKVTLNGIAQGYAADRALAALRSHGIGHALIDTGELAALGAKPQRSGWRVGVQHPRESDAFVVLANLKDRCLSTSGDYATCFSADRRFHHVFDPATGVSPGELASVSVAAPTAMQADAWSTASLVLGMKRAAGMLQSLPDHDACFVLKDGRMLATPGFPMEAEGAT